METKPLRKSEVEFSPVSPYRFHHNAALSLRCVGSAILNCSLQRSSGTIHFPFFHAQAKLTFYVSFALDVCKAARSRFPFSQRGHVSLKTASHKLAVSLKSLKFYCCSFKHLNVIVTCRRWAARHRVQELLLRSFQEVCPALNPSASWNVTEASKISLIVRRQLGWRATSTLCHRHRFNFVWAPHQPEESQSEWD